ncbi:hypothetical protein [Adhaeretor mobilis]|uniref:Uncharacterized protein n=1 Tax=Adhaeretor mobilis TaxID=1930276 RepID=A0A517MT58_9BACT|nr:hypothetical protein [Adhaeretor mobilis]QDS98058.1 hypothetical protein HG15A2_13290 [Adhaeretor mobilis]
MKSTKGSTTAWLLLPVQACCGMVCHFPPLEWLTIERMRASHGTINFLGYALRGTLASPTQSSEAT